MSTRGTFLQASAAFALAAGGTAIAGELHVGATTTQDALFALGTPGRRGEWVRLIISSGAAYQKHIGLGSEDAAEPIAFVETQIGMPGGACNPNTLKKTYLRTDRFGTLIATPPVLACVAQSGSMLTRWADAGAGQHQAAADAQLRLLDVPYVYTHIVGRFAAKPLAGRLERIELWLTPHVPFGVARYRALARGLDPFDVSVYSFGHRFRSELAMSLRTVRAMTPNGDATSISSAL